MVNVKDAIYGAKGDGVTDDTAAIQAAVNAATNGCRTVLLPADMSGTTVYLINSRITVPAGVTLSGEGIGSQIKCGTSGAGVDVGDGTNIPYNAVLSDLTILGNNVQES